MVSWGLPGNRAAYSSRLGVQEYSLGEQRGEGCRGVGYEWFTGRGGLQQALCRRNKRGAVVVGAPGVGKRALIHGLAQALARGQVPAPLLGLRLVELDATALVGGTRYRGELEARVNSLGKQLAAQGRSILFIDGLDQVAGQPGAQGASETGQLLAGLLAQCPTLRLLATAGDGGSNTNV